MNRSKLSALCLASGGILAACSPPPESSQIVACHLFSESTLSSLVGFNLERKPAAHQGTLSYGAIRSVCGHYHPRLWVLWHLAEFPSPNEASKEFVQHTTKQYVSEKSVDGENEMLVEYQIGLGDKAAWVELAGDSHVYVVLKGNFVFNLTVRSRDGADGAVLKDRLRPLVQEASGRL
jgi:hypothetical protein